MDDDDDYGSPRRWSAPVLALAVLVVVAMLLALLGGFVAVVFGAA